MGKIDADNKGRLELGALGAGGKKWVPSGKG